MQNNDAKLAPRAPRQPRSVAKKKPVAAPLAAVPLTEVIKARKAQDNALRARLKVLDREISKLMGEYDQIAGILGIVKQSDNEPPAPPVTVYAWGPSPPETQPSETAYKCADCGSSIGPNAKNECDACGAYPFEQAL
jgi:hypothetical protein